MAFLTKKLNEIFDFEFLSDAVRSRYTRYLMYTIFDQVMPDLTDGLKPVGRRVLYQMWRMGALPTKEVVKAARVIGNTIGALHPHGESGVMSALNTMVNCANAPVIGQGNWGSIQSPLHGSARYINCKLSTYGMYLLDPDYLAVSPYMPNYDGKEEEPIVLPALLPNLFLNGAEGIAAGYSTKIPPLDPIPLLSLTQRLLKNENVQARDAAKTVSAKYRYGGITCLDTPQDKENWLQWWETGKASITIKPIFKISEKKDRLLITGFGPTITYFKSTKDAKGKKKLINTLRYIVGQLNLDPRLEQAQDITDKKSKVDCEFEILIKKKFSSEETVNDVLKYFYCRQHYQTAVIEQSRQTVETVEEVKSEFYSNISPLEVLKKWCIYRIDLEEKYLRYKIEKQQDSLKNTELFILACINRDIILKAIESKDPDAHLIKALSLSKDEVKRILDLPVRRLSVMDQTALKLKLKEQKAELKTWQDHLKNPVIKIVQDIEKAKSLFKKGH